MTFATTLRKGIWIASYPKSGNTWVRAFIHNILNELHAGTAAAQDINSLHKHTVWEVKAEPYEHLLGKPVTQCSVRDISRVRPRVQRLLSESRKGPFFIKTHQCVAVFKGFPTINFNMTMAAIYIVRNPLDVAISYAHYDGLEINEAIARMALPNFGMRGRPEATVYELLGSWSRHVASWMSVWQVPIYAMRFEDMLASPLRVFGELANFLRLAPTAEQLQRAVDNSSFSELSRQEALGGSVEKPPTAGKFFRAGKANQWREALTGDQIQKVVSAHGPVMQRCGYLKPDCGGHIQ